MNIYRAKGASQHATYKGGGDDDDDIIQRENSTAHVPTVLAVRKIGDGRHGDGNPF